MVETCPVWCDGVHAIEHGPEFPGEMHQSAVVEVQTGDPGQPICVGVRAERDRDGTWRQFVAVGRVGEDPARLDATAAEELARCLGKFAGLVDRLVL